MRISREGPISKEIERRSHSIFKLMNVIGFNYLKKKSMSHRLPPSDFFMLTVAHFFSFPQMTAEVSFIIEQRVPVNSGGK